MGVERGPRFPGLLDACPCFANDATMFWRQNATTSGEKTPERFA